MFRSKPRTIEAEQFWPDQPLPFGDKGPYVQYDGRNWQVVTAHAQAVILAPGDWVVPEPSGPDTIAFAAYPIKPDIFAATYEPVE